MTSTALLPRLERLAPELSPARSDVAVRCEGDDVVFERSARYVRRVRRVVRGGGLLGVGAGLALATVLPLAGAAAFVLGALAAWFGPRAVRPAILLRLEADSQRLVVLQRAADAGAAFSLSAITGVAGRYEVFGWEPRSVVYVERADGPPAPVLVFSGTDEQLATFACRALGSLLDVPARYTGPYGGTERCFQPSACASIEA